MRVVPDWREMNSVLRVVLISAFIGFMMSLVIVACQDEYYFGKTREELAKEMFLLDSLMIDLQYQLDSTSVDFEKIYLNAKRINSGHN